MYDNEENNVNWAGIIKRILFMLGILLITFGIVSLMSKCSNKKIVDEPTNNEPVIISLDEQLNLIEAAALKYFNEDTLPTDLNDSKTIKLKYLINKDLITEVVLDDQTICDSNSSFVEITKLENNYLIKTTATCGENTQSKLSYTGCFDRCDGGLCLTDDAEENGICGYNEDIIVKPENNTKPEQSPATPQVVPAKTQYEFKKCTTTYSCTPNVNGVCDIRETKTLTGKVLTNTTKTPLCATGYAYQNGTCQRTANATANTSYTCTDNSYSYKNGTCQKTTNATSNTTYGCSNSTYTYQNGTCQKTTNASYGEVSKYFTSTNTLKNEGYTFVRYENGKYLGTKNEYSCSSGTLTSDNKCKITDSSLVTKNTTYSCSSGNRLGSTCVIINDSFVKKATNYTCSSGTLSGTSCIISDSSKLSYNTSTSYSCEDKSYTYNSSSKTCTKNVTTSKTVVPTKNETCQTKWSTETYLEGWTRTGKIK